MDNFIPNMYKKDILDIDYEKLKNLGIKCLIFDLDNTIALIDEKTIPSRVEELFKDIKKDFRLVIISNNTKKRISAFCEPFDTPFVSFAMKPLTCGFSKIKKKYGLKKEEMCMIGDQLMTDVLGGNIFGIYTILVDPLGKKDLKITSVNRFFENKIITKLAKMNILERGKYYG
ncbi:MAG: YqeG family HAD IIIA-type phosphatase [Bacilli bacterium]